MTPQRQCATMISLFISAVVVYPGSPFASILIFLVIAAWASVFFKDEDLF